MSDVIWCVTFSIDVGVTLKVEFTLNNKCSAKFFVIIDDNWEAPHDSIKIVVAVWSVALGFDVGELVFSEFWLSFDNGPGRRVSPMSEIIK